MNGDETATVTVERDLPHAPETVWRALTEAALIGEWLGMRAEGFAPEPGRDFALRGDWGGVACRVLAVEPGRRLVWAWDHPSEDPTFDLRSTVTFTLDPRDGGTRLRVEQAGFRPGQGRAQGGARAGWPQHLERLAGVVAGLG